MIRVGDCREVLATMDADSVDAIVTDPPYGLGFMGKAWDHAVPGVEFWDAMLRVAKPGAHLAAFGGSRTFHRMACAIEDAGWELRDSVLRMHDGRAVVAREDCPWLAGWVYGSGFPKSHNGEWGGTALKPAWEPIILARKPLAGTVEGNWREHGTGALNIDGCRVLNQGEERAPVTGRGAIPARHGDAAPRAPGSVAQPHELGRWPANVIHDGSEEVLAAFPDAPGQLRDTGPEFHRRAQVFGTYAGVTPHKVRGDAGSAARFFYCAKANRGDRNDGLDGFEARRFGMSGGASAAAARGEGYDNGDGGINRVTLRRNHHPTVKPTELMRWLCRLVTPPGGLVLDPFTGSGSTGRGAIAEGFRFQGIELDPEYAAIAEARIRAVQPGLSIPMCA